MLHKTRIEDIYEALKRAQEELATELRELPEGYLSVYVRKDGVYYSNIIPKKGNRKKAVRKGITKDKTLVKALVRKKYVEEAAALVEKDLSILENAVKKYIPFDENSVMGEFARNHPELADCVYRDAGDIDEWASNYERQKDFYEEDRTSVAGDGQLMRSRGEIIIAEKLRQYKIPFRYEASLGIPDLPYVPDFTIRRPKDGKIFYWEHFGDVTDEQYMTRNARKLERYEEYGIVPWDNLIISYDFENGGVNTPLIEGLIHAWLL